MDNILQKLREPLKITDVDFRIQSINPQGYATIVTYKDARVDMNRLDAICGDKWQKDYKTIEGRLYCGVAIKIADEWIWRWDVGVDSNVEKAKGAASDAFKRACFNWGIGRELYNYPIIQLKLNQDEFTPNGNQGKATWKLRLKEWVWQVNVDTEGNVSSLTGVDQNGVVRYTYPQQQKQQQQQQTQQPQQPQQPSQQSPQQPAPNSNSQQPADLPWLNIMDKEKNFTRHWLNLQKAIREKKITTIAQIRQHYKVSKEVQNKLITENKLS